MKQTIIYIISMLILIVFLPLIITKGFGSPFYIPQPVKKPQAQKTELQIYNHKEKKLFNMDLEEYVKGVVAAEMPAAFEPEALKAQAVAARTYALGRLLQYYTPKQQPHPEAAVCTDPMHCQAWMSKEDALKKWSIFTANIYWKKISDAVDSTSGLAIYYDNKLINPLYHSCSPGKTESSSELWDGKEFPYLKSVTSEGDEKCPSYKTFLQLSKSEFYSAFKTAYPEISRNNSPLKSELRITEKSESGRVKKLELNNTVISGSAFREILGLNSTCIQFEYPSEDEIKIIVTGNGHGAGMSQWGANGLALQGGSYKEILTHYYQGTQISY